MLMDNSSMFRKVLDRIPFNPATMLKKNTRVSFEIYKDRKGLKRGRIIN